MTCSLVLPIWVCLLQCCPVRCSCFGMTTDEHSLPCCTCNAVRTLQNIVHLVFMHINVGKATLHQKAGPINALTSVTFYFSSKQPFIDKTTFGCSKLGGGVLIVIMVSVLQGTPEHDACISGHASKQSDTHVRHCRHAYPVDWSAQI